MTENFTAYFEYSSRLRTIISPAPQSRRHPYWEHGLPARGTSSQQRRYEHRLRARMPAFPGRPRPWQAHRTGPRIVGNRVDIRSGFGGVDARREPCEGSAV